MVLSSFSCFYCFININMFSFFFVFFFGGGGGWWVGEGAVDSVCSSAGVLVNLFQGGLVKDNGNRSEKGFTFNPCPGF